MSTVGHILLIGLRGSGKSTLGRRLAETLGRQFIDLDDRTPALLGCASVAEAWTRLGEAKFRDAETLALRESLGSPVSVIALGGGTPTAPDAIEVIRSAPDARVVYLRATAGTLRSRLERADNRHRPSLTGAGTLEEIGPVLAARDPLYRRIATLIVDVDGRSESQVLDLILQDLEEPRADAE